jgi:hypothetical protein
MTDDFWRCPSCNVGARVTDATSEGLLCYCKTREANLPDHGTEGNPCADARCGDCGWKGKMTTTTYSKAAMTDANTVIRCTVCDAVACPHTDADRKKHEEDLAWHDHKERYPDPES